MTPGNTSPITGDHMARPGPRRRGRRSVGVLALATLAPALVVGLATGVATAPAAQAAPAGCTTAQLVTTCTFNYTGAAQTWTVPAGVDHATFTVVGASGGRAGGRPGGLGGGVSATLGVEQARSISSTSAARAATTPTPRTQGSAAGTAARTAVA